MNIANLLQDHARQHPEAIALVDVHRGKHRSVTYRQLEQASARVATLLRQHGLKPGDNVLVMQPMSAELYIALAAIFRLGMVAMFLDPSAGNLHIRLCCQLRPPQALIASSKAHLLRLTSPALRRIPRAFSIGRTIPCAVSLRKAAQLRYDAAIHPCQPDAAALLTFTSGSTAEPKAALRTHGFLLAQHQALHQSLALQAGEVDLTTQPIFVLANLASRVTSLIPNADLRRPGAIDPAPIMAQLHEQRATRCAASPATLQRVVDYCSTHGITFPRLSRVFTGGGPVSPRLLDDLHGIAPQATIHAVYGCTEAEPIACVARHQIDDEDMHAMANGRGLLAGKPLPILRLRIMRDQWGTPIGPLHSDQFEAICQPQGQIGEIVVSGEHVLRGYVNGCADRDNKFDVDGQRWHRTGDAGYLDQRGRLWLLGRCSARIDDAYGTLYPLIVEHAASHHVCLHRATVASVRGQRVLAVQPRQNRLNQADAKRVLASVAFAHIARIEILRHLPVDSRHNAKIDYPAVTALLEKRA